MNKIIAIVAVILAFAAKADYLYWMIDTSSAAAFTYDKLVLKGDSTTLDDGITYTAMSAIGGDTLNDKVATYYGTYGQAFEYDLGSNSYTSYFVELYNGDSWVAQSTSIAGLSGAVFKGGAGLPATPATFGTFAVPEPTSGLLFVLGGMLLGLKRRRQQV